MDCRISELQYKEVVDIADGTRYGYISDLEMDSDTGTILNIIIAGKIRCFGLFGRESDIIFPWSAIKRIGADIILVDTGENLRQSSESLPEKPNIFLKNR